MINIFLKAKHWHLFLLTYGLPLFLQFGLIGFIFTNVGDVDTVNTSSDSFSSLKFFSIIMILFLAVLFGWSWSVAIGLQSKVPKRVKMKVNKYKILFFIPLVYYLFFIGFYMISVTGNALNSMALIITIPLHLISLFGMFYNLYFVAKTIKTVELQREVSFSDFVGEILLICLYPIGIWIVQPKINKMIE